VGQTFENGAEVWGEAQRKAEEVSRRGIDWLENHGDRPFFLSLHYYDRHFPYGPPPACKTFARY